MSKIIIASGPVIVRDGKVLLNKHGDTPFWKFCGGQTQEGENLIGTAVRRVKEEMGLDINILNNEPFLMYTNKEAKEGVDDVVLAHFLAESTNEVKPAEDIREWDWLDISNLPEDLAPNIIPALKHFGFLS